MAGLKGDHLYNSLGNMRLSDWSDKNCKGGIKLVKAYLLIKWNNIIENFFSAVIFL